MLVFVCSFNQASLYSFLVLASLCRLQTRLDSVMDLMSDGSKNATLEKLDFVTWIRTILILDLFCHISQHDRKISPVSKNHTFWRHANNFRCNDWRPDSCILYPHPHHIQEKSRKGRAQRWTEIFTDSKTELMGTFLYPKSQYEG